MTGMIGPRILRRDGMGGHPLAVRSTETGTTPSPIIRPGRNCWRLERAKRARALIDAGEYFSTLEGCLRTARRSILIAGWDFDGRIRLRPDASEGDSPPLGPFLRSLVENNPDLEINILVWSISFVHAPGSALELLLGADWQDHPRLNLKLDSHHPIYGAHHQKIVCIDDSLAFVGGIDLTIERWDTPEHEPNHPLRIAPSGSAYAPVHDLQMIVDGDAARAVADQVRDRWQSAVKEELKPCDLARELWPQTLAPQFTDVDVAIARTLPDYGSQQEATEAANLTHHAIASARKLIYIEAQYLTAAPMGRILARRLKEPDGPEVMVVMNHTARGNIEKVVMGMNADRLIRRLAKADRFKRLRVCYPVNCVGEEEHDIFVHAKLLIVDDRLVRIGSSNLNNRSIGLDTECDVAIEADRSATCKSIEALRLRLLSEHLGCTPAALEKMEAELGSTVQAVDRLSPGSRGLRRFDSLDDGGPTWFLPGAFLFDPRHVFRWFRR